MLIAVCNVPLIALTRSNHASGAICGMNDCTAGVWIPPPAERMTRTTRISPVSPQPTATVGLHGWIRSPLNYGSSSTILRLFTSAFFHAAHARRPRYVQLLDEHRHAARHRAQPVADKLERWANRRTNRRCAHAGRPWKPP